MFFKAKCPIGTWDKTWVEYKMQWFADQFGADCMRSAPMVMPTKEFFPDVFEPTEESASAYKDRIAELMGIDPSSCGFELCEPEQSEAVMKRYVADGPKIRLSAEELQDPVETINSLAFSMAQHVLIHGEHVSKEAPDAPDFSRIVDLLTVFFGFGAIGANANVRFHPEAATRQLFFTPQIIGYGLALFSWQRDDADPAWMNLLRPDAREAAQSGIKYLKKTSDSIFSLDQTAEQRWNEASSIEALQSDSATERLAGLWQLSKIFKDSDRTLPEQAARNVVKCTRHRDNAVRTSAVEVLRLATLNDDVTEALRHATMDAHEHVRGYAAGSIGALGEASEELRDSLVKLLSDPSDMVFYRAAVSLADLDQTDEEVTKPILNRLKNSLVDCNYPFAEEITRVMARMRDDYVEHIRSCFANDEQLQHQAGEVLESVTAATSS